MPARTDESSLAAIRGAALTAAAGGDQGHVPAAHGGGAITGGRRFGTCQSFSQRVYVPARRV